MQTRPGAARRRLPLVLLALLLVLSSAHLVAQWLSAEGTANVTQWLLMPTLAGVLLTAPGTDTGSRLVRLTLLALGLSWLGDTAPYLADGDAAFLVMVAFFLLAQAAYILAFWPHRRSSVLHQRPILVVPYAVTIAALVWACAPHTGPLLVPVLAYGLCLGAMAVLSTGLNVLTALGGALFLISDGLIALRAFVPGLDLSQGGFWVMLTYVAAQLLLVLGVLHETSAARQRVDAGPGLRQGAGHGR
jgi:uncharacterized membrane protein YhhN